MTFALNIDIIRLHKTDRIGKYKNNKKLTIIEELSYMWPVIYD